MSGEEPKIKSAYDGVVEHTTEWSTLDYCAVCGESPQSAAHGPFSSSHEYVPPTRNTLAGNWNQPLTFDFKDDGMWSPSVRYGELLVIPCKECERKKAETDELTRLVWNLKTELLQAKLERDAAVSTLLAVQALISRTK